jgi:hypothetical protein
MEQKMTKVVTDQFLRDLCCRAGLTEDEMTEHPTDGLILSVSGARKLCKAAQDQERAKALEAYLDRIVEKKFKTNLH